MDLTLPPPPSVSSDRALCHCFGVTESRIRQIADECPFATLQTVRQQTHAGGGCTACHRRIKNLLQRHQAERLADSQPAYTGESGFPSPICCAR